MLCEAYACYCRELFTIGCPLLLGSDHQNYPFITSSSDYPTSSSSSLPVPIAAVIATAVEYDNACDLSISDHTCSPRARHNNNIYSNHFNKPHMRISRTM
jgi:hypothetical protein